MLRPLGFFMCWAFVLNSVISYRLPTSVVPTRYKLEILSYLGVPDNFSFDGKVWIQVTCHQPTHNITLHSKDLNITSNQVTVRQISGDSKNVKVKSIDLDKVNDFLVINLDQQLQKDNNYEIFIPFSGLMEDGLKGFYRSSYTDEETKEKKWLGITQFEATSARKAFPCFDEPAMKAVFEITLGRKEGYSSISNMPLMASEPIKEKSGWFWDRYGPTVPMSTYLVAYMVSDFGYSTSEPSLTNNVTFKIWARKSALDQVDFAREVGPKFLEYFEDFFAIKYPLPKTDMVAIPDFSAGAMENWGLITYREALLLFDPKISSLTNQHRIAGVIAHELAHQWFGNLVTMKWWTDLWLNEGFATYMATRAVGHLFPQWDSLEEDAVSGALNVLSFDALKSSHPVSVPIGHPNDIDEIFDTISYKKGSFLIRMMTLFLGDDTLRKGVSAYLKKHEYGNAEQDDLWDSLTEEAHRNGALPANLTVKTVMDTWTLQIGYPLITVERDYASGTARISQRRFIKDRLRDLEDEDTCWWVPLSYTDGRRLDFNNTKPKSWLACPKQTVVLRDMPDAHTWIIFNMQVGSLYKVNYDERNWNLISETLNSQDHVTVPVLDKVLLIENAFDLAATGHLKYDIVFDLIEYLKYEEEYLPWKASLANIKYLYGQLRKTSLFGNFKTYLKRLITPIYEKLGGLHISVSKRDRLAFVKHQVSTASWACRFGLADCVSEAQSLFRKYQQDPDNKNIIPKDFRSVLYCTVIRNGSEKEWDFLWAQYKKSNVASEKNTILRSLGCTNEIWLLRRFLEWSLKDDSGIRRQDSATVFSAVAGNEVGYYIARDFLYTRVKDIYDHLSQTSKRLSSYVSSMGSHTTNEEEYKELQNFVNENQKYLKDIKQGVQQALENAKLNVQWQQRHLNDIERLLHKVNERANDKV